MVHRQANPQQRFPMEANLCTHTPVALVIFQKMLPAEVCIMRRIKKGLLGKL